MTNCFFWGGEAIYLPTCLPVFRSIYGICLSIYLFQSWNRWNRVCSTIVSCLSVCFFTASAFQADWRCLDGNKVSKVGVLDELPVTTTPRVTWNSVRTPLSGLVPQWDSASSSVRFSNRKGLAIILREHKMDFGAMAQPWHSLASSPPVGAFGRIACWRVAWSWDMAPL